MKVSRVSTDYGEMAAEITVAWVSSTESSRDDSPDSCVDRELYEENRLELQLGLLTQHRESGEC